MCVIGNDILGRISIEQSPNEIMINQSDKIFRQRRELKKLWELQ